MGYYTRYDLVQPEIEDEILEYVEQHGYMSYAFLEAQDCKWYGHEADMIEISLQFPDVLFELHGEGEDAGDLWTKYFKNGKMQVCEAQIYYPPFDESKLA